jgi:hypothetical protein
VSARSRIQDMSLTEFYVLSQVAEDNHEVSFEHVVCHVRLRQQWSCEEAKAEEY